MRPAAPRSRIGVLYWVMSGGFEPCITSLSVFWKSAASVYWCLTVTCGYFFSYAAMMVVMSLLLSQSAMVMVTFALGTTVETAVEPLCEDDGVRTLHPARVAIVAMPARTSVSFRRVAMVC